MDDKKLELSEDFINSIRDLNALCSQQEDSAVAMLYRLMFRHERNIDILDSYALCGFGGEYAEEDYRNYLQYLKAVVPEEYESHKNMFEEDLKMLQDENIEEDE